MKKIIAFIICLFFFYVVSAQNNREISLKFLHYLSGLHYDSAATFFDKTLTEKLPVEKLSQTWNALNQQAGKYKNSKGITTEEKQGYEIILITCEFEKMLLDLKLVYNNEHRISGLFFVPSKPTVSYKKPSYDNDSLYKEIALNVTTGNFTLPAILTLPKAGNKFPVIILVQGSGPNDKDETIGPNKIFRDLAVGLSAKGVATLRYDKRTKVYGEEIKHAKGKITVNEEVIEDAISAINMAKKNKEIDTTKIFLLGHSLGGMLAPRIAKSTTGLTGIIIMAGNARPLEDLILEQTEYILSIDGLTEDKKNQIDTLKKQVSEIKNINSSQMSSQKTFLNVPAAYWIDLKNYNQTAVAKQLNTNIFILQGERDYQVTMQDFSIWKKELANKKNVMFKSYPKLNHLFIEGEGKSTPQEYEKQGNVANYVMVDIAKWITK